MGLINFPEGPLGSCKGALQKMLRLLGGLLGAKRSSRSPLWPPLEITKRDFFEKRDFLKITEMLIFITILAPMEKPLPLQNAHLGARGPSWAPLGAAPCPSGPPWNVPGADHFPLGAPLGPPKTDPGASKAPRNRPRGARSAQGPHQIHKVNMLKTLEIQTFALPGSQKMLSGDFSTLRDLPRDPLE